MSEPHTPRHEAALTPSHVALIIEDDEPTAAILGELVASLGHEWRHASTLQEVRVAIEKGGYCYVLLDMQIPADKHGRPLSSSGETALSLLRKKNPQRNAEFRHLLPILVVTGYSREPEFVVKMINAGADGFIPKPFGDRIERVLDDVRATLDRARRADHEQCAQASAAEVQGPSVPPGASPAPGPAVRLVIDGGAGTRRSAIVANGTRVDLQDAHFEFLVRLVAAHATSPGAWRDRQELGIARRRETPSRVGKEIATAAGESLAIVESDGRGGVRLNPCVAVRVDWDALIEHPSGVVKKIAAERQKRDR